MNKPCLECGGIGWVYPNLGVTRPAGDCHGDFHPDECPSCHNPHKHKADIWFIFYETINPAKTFLNRLDNHPSYDMM